MEKAEWPMTQKWKRRAQMAELEITDNHSQGVGLKLIYKLVTYVWLNFRTSMDQWLSCASCFLHCWVGVSFEIILCWLTVVHWRWVREGQRSSLASGLQIQRNCNSRVAPMDMYPRNLICIWTWFREWCAGSWPWPKCCNERRFLHLKNALIICGQRVDSGELMIAADYLTLFPSCGGVCAPSLWI